MRCCLLQPPLCDPSCPSLGLAYLSSMLAEQNIAYEIFDLNLDFIEFIEAATKISSNQLNVVSSIQRTSIALDFANTIFPSVKMSAFALEIPNNNGRLAEIATTALDTNGVFSRWINCRDPIAKVLALKPDWIGITVSFLGQFPAALALAAACKHKSRADIILGGALFKDFEGYLGSDTPIWEHVDGVVVGPGEEIVRSFYKTGNGHILPSLGRVDLPNGGWIAKSINIYDPPSPDFSRFPLQKYKSAGLVLPYRVYARCSWGKCTFCADGKYAAHFPAARGKPASVAKEIKEMAARYNAQGIYFLDAELPEHFLISFAKCYMDMHNELRWGANARFSKRLTDSLQAQQLYDGGCRFLRFGLESASPRILQLMNKGIDPILAEDVLTAVHEAGIATHVYLMRGFPGETEEDWHETEGFLLRNASRIDMFNVSVFQLYIGSPLYHSLGRQLVHCEAAEDRWVYPTLAVHENYRNTFQKLEESFFELKNGTRCHPTPADTILLADSSPIKYGNAFWQDGQDAIR